MGCSSSHPFMCSIFIAEFISPVVHPGRVLLMRASVKQERGKWVVSIALARSADDCSLYYLPVVVSKVAVNQFESVHLQPAFCWETFGGEADLHQVKHGEGPWVLVDLKHTNITFVHCQSCQLSINTIRIDAHREEKRWKEEGRALLWPIGPSQSQSKSQVLLSCPKIQRFVPHSCRLFLPSAKI